MFQRLICHAWLCLAYFISRVFQFHVVTSDRIQFSLWLNSILLHGILEYSNNIRTIIVIFWKLEYNIITKILILIQHTHLNSDLPVSFVLIWMYVCGFISVLFCHTCSSYINQHSEETKPFHHKYSSFCTFFLFCPLLIVTIPCQSLLCSFFLKFLNFKNFKFGII